MKNTPTHPRNSIAKIKDSSICDLTSHEYDRLLDCRMIEEGCPHYDLESSPKKDSTTHSPATNK